MTGDSFGRTQPINEGNPLVSIPRQPVWAPLTADAGSARPFCLRCEVPIYRDESGVWRREATGVADCPRNPAGDGHEPTPADAGSALDVDGIAAVLRERGESEGLMWGALNLSDETYAALAEAVAAHVEALREADRAAAWDEGHDAGHQDARAVQATYPEPTPNPYRSES